MNAIEIKAAEIERELEAQKVMWRHQIGVYSSDLLKSIYKLKKLAEEIKREARNLQAP